MQRVGKRCKRVKKATKAKKAKRIVFKKPPFTG
jgi:hypothetical protein